MELATIGLFATATIQAASAVAVVLLTRRLTLATERYQRDTERLVDEARVQQKYVEEQRVRDAADRVIRITRKLAPLVVAMGRTEADSNEFTVLWNAFADAQNDFAAEIGLLPVDAQDRVRSFELVMYMGLDSVWKRYYSPEEVASAMMTAVSAVEDEVGCLRRDEPMPPTKLPTSPGMTHPWLQQHRTTYLFGKPVAPNAAVGGVVLGPVGSPEV